VIHAVGVQQTEVGLHWHVLALPEEEEAGLLFVDTSHHPLGVAGVILNFLGFVSEAGDEHECVLQVLSQDVLVLVALEQRVEVVHLHFFLLRHGWAYEAHLAHGCFHHRILQNVLLGVRLTKLRVVAICSHV